MKKAPVQKSQEPEDPNKEEAEEAIIPEEEIEEAKGKSGEANGSGKAKTYSAWPSTSISTPLEEFRTQPDRPRRRARP